MFKDWHLIYFRLLDHYLNYFLQRKQGRLHSPRATDAVSADPGEIPESSILSKWKQEDQSHQADVKKYNDQVTSPDTQESRNDVALEGKKDTKPRAEMVSLSFKRLCETDSL